MPPRPVPEPTKAPPHGVYVHGLGVSRMSTVEFAGPQRQVEPLTVEELQDSIRRVSGTDVTITTLVRALGTWFGQPS
jgi:hypothetical protein